MTKVMLVEDDNNLREIYQARLQAEGYTIVSAQDGEEALVVAKAEKPDLIISDVMMPKISGFEMLDILRNTDGLKDVKVIMLTALGQSDDQQRADRLGADRYLVKSQVTLEDIVKTARQLLEGENQEAAAAVVASVSNDSPAEPAPTAAPDPAAASSQPAPVSDTVTDTSNPILSDNASSNVPATATQSTVQEEASVEAQIEDFVAGATSDPTPPPDSGTVAALPEPSLPVVGTAPQPSVIPGPVQVDTPSSDPAGASTPESITTPTAEAVTPPPIPTVITPLDSGEAVDEAAAEPGPQIDSVPEPSDANPATIAHKKIIAPIDSQPKKDLNALLAAEEAKQPAPQTSPVSDAPSEPLATPPPAAPASDDNEQPADPSSITL